MLQMPGRWSQVLAVLIACTYTLNTPIRNLGIKRMHACMHACKESVTCTHRRDLGSPHGQ